MLITKISYSISNFKVEDFDFDFESVNFDLSTDGIIVDSKNDKVSISFDWEYSETKSGISDNGTGLATSNNMELKLTFHVESTSSVKISSCTLKLKDFGMYDIIQDRFLLVITCIPPDMDFNTTNSASSWLYDSAVELFSGKVTDQIESQVCDLLKGQIFEF